MTSTAAETTDNDASLVDDDGEGHDHGPGVIDDDRLEEKRAWRRAMVKGLFAYVVSRIMVLAGTGIVAAQ